jgi:hypothetical protein
MTTLSVGSQDQLDGMGCLGVFATEYLPSRVNRVIKLLKEFERSIITDSMIDWEESFVRKYPNLKSSLEEFKRRYKEG